MKTWKKGLALFLALSMMIPGIYLGGKESKEVQAADTEAEQVAETSASAIVLESDLIYSKDVVKSKLGRSEEAPTKDGYLFAGWYNDRDYKSPIKTEDDVKGDDAGNVYAKFVQEGVLSIKTQATTQKVTNKDTEITDGQERYNDMYVLRFVSSVDSLDYKEVGFVLKEDKSEAKLKYTTTKVFKRIKSTTTGVGAYDEFSPKLVDTKSEYFITAKHPVAENDIEMNITVQAYWTTYDGTVVYGTPRCVSVNDGKIGISTINMSFVNVTENKITTDDKLKIDGYSAAIAEVIDVSEDGTVHVRISGIDKTTLKSVTKFIFKDGTDPVGSAIYRRYDTEYVNSTTTGSIDTSWYDVDKTATEFTIATSADLFGFATLVNDNKELFEKKTVYMITDITIGTGKSSDWVNKNTTGAKTWPTIGNATACKFKGTFDGQEHFISGLYFGGSGSNKALFGQLDEVATVQHLRIKNSYLSGQRAIGVVAGQGGALIEDIRVEDDVYVRSTQDWSGGLIGKVSFATTVIKCSSAADVEGTTESGGLIGEITGADATIAQCSFTGSITGSGNNIGGLVGRVSQQATVRNCEVAATVTGSTQMVGGIIGGTTANTTVETSKFSGTVTGSNNQVGGLVGQIGGEAKISNCEVTAEAEINGSAQVGGLIGETAAGNTEINTSKFNGKVTGTGQGIGGVVGAVHAQTKVINCEVGKSAAITGVNSAVGGLIGAMSTNGGSVDTCKFSGTATGIAKIGGIIGSISGVTATVSNCYVTSEAEIKQNATDGNTGVGGIIGWIESTPAETPVKVEYCLNEGTIEHDIENQTANKGRARIGGICGTVAGAGILNVYNSLSVGTFIYPTKDTDQRVTETNLLVGAFLGMVGGTATVEVNNSYAFGDSSHGSGSIAFNSSKLVKGSEAQSGLIGEAALENAKTLFEENNGAAYWEISETTPKLIHFNNK